MTSATGLQYTANSSGPSTDPWVLRLPGWFQKTDAALDLKTVSGPVDMTESRIVQSQKLRTLSAAALSVSSAEGCGEIEAYKQCDFLVVSHSVDAVKDIEQRCLGRMSLSVVCCLLKFLELVRWGRRRASTSLSSTLETVDKLDIGL